MTEIYAAGRHVFYDEPDIQELFYIDYYQSMGKLNRKKTEEENLPEETKVLKFLCKPQISRCIDYFKHLNTDGGFSWQKKNMATQHFERLLTSVVSKTYKGLTNWLRS